MKEPNIEIDCHLIREKIVSRGIKTGFVNSNDQLGYIFTKPLRGPNIDYICNKLGTYDLYAPNFFLSSYMPQLEREC